MESRDDFTGCREIRSQEAEERTSGAKARMILVGYVRAEARTYLPCSKMSFWSLENRGRLQRDEVRAARTGIFNPVPLGRLKFRAVHVIGLFDSVSLIDWTWLCGHGVFRNQVGGGSAVEVALFDFAQG